ncbi:WhiB family transcriptional regulator [Nocardioides sp. GY 10127]|uniref:WhiB family transcriptional regulator n=1 Tax=Nocardioides sp. GY 10127 TaxID=2569762 RepID=UPI0010A871CD|nr:WhiB family transcriptional regulator [Nocardioides sp. GY 10127]TIC86366.1 hypothetical protein E8D37_00160 [Nocardioides sp. GY 10127]
MHHESTGSQAAALKTQPAGLAEARCRDAADLPWIAEPATRSLDQRLEMAGICLTCPVSHDCEQATLELEITSGFWNGRDRTPLPHHCHAHAPRHDAGPEHGWGAA